MKGNRTSQRAQRCRDYEFQKGPTDDSADARIGAGRKLRSRDKLLRTMANGRQNRIGIRIAEAPSGVDVFRLEITWHLNAWEQ